MFGSNKRVQELEYEVAELKLIIKNMVERVGNVEKDMKTLTELDVIKDTVHEAMDGIDLDGMAESAIERVLDNASLSIRF